jgi:hypothetical protein
MESPFSIRKTVSLTLGLSFLVMTVTGLVLFIVPKGKVAYWSDWLFMGLTKEQWGDLHITSMLLLVVTAVWHIYYNWTPLVSYLKNSAKKITFLKKEFVVAAVLNVAFVLGTLYAVPPFQSLLDLNTGIKDYWEETYGSPPYGHAEESSLKAFSRHIGVQEDEALKRLKAEGIQVNSSADSLKTIGRNNGIAPQRIYEVIKPSGDKVKRGNAEGITFLGRRTLHELSEMNKIDLDKSLAYLKKKGLNATQEMRMREVADHFELTPYEMYERLKKVSMK